MCACTVIMVWRQTEGLRGLAWVGIRKTADVGVRYSVCTSGDDGRRSGM